MRINSIGLVNFRNHELFRLELTPGSTAIIGRNGLGKTNVIEAIHYTSTLQSHRVNQDGPLIKHNCDSAFIELCAQKQNRQAKVAVTINREKPNTFEVNGSQTRKPKDVAGIIQTVIFSPEDLNLVKNEPASRRNFLDEFLILQTPRLVEVKHNYEKALKQRNSLLKSAAGRPLGETAKATLSAWDEQLIKFGAELVFNRLNAIEKLVPHLTEFGNVISGATEPIQASYQASWLTKNARDLTEISNQLQTALESKIKEEISRGQTLSGPHRDDLLLELNSAPVRNFASHGQSWSVAIALRLATFAVLREFESDPILILDDVFAELDARRRSRLISVISAVEQTLITVADTKDIPDELKSTNYWLPDELTHADQ